VLPEKRGVVPSRLIHNQMKIAFYSAKPYSGGNPLVGMPFAANIVRCFAKEGHSVDLWIAESTSDTEREFSSLPTVTVRYLNGFFRRGKSLRLKFAWLHPSVGHDYDLAIGLGPIGAFLARKTADSSNCPLILCNDELHSSYAGQFGSELGLDAYRRADAIIVPDLNRWPALLREMPEIARTRVFELPNVPIELLHSGMVDWYHCAGLPKGKKIVTYAGGIGGWNQIPELLTTVPKWGDDFVLAIRSFPWNPSDHPSRRELSHLEHPKVFWIDDSEVNEPMVNSLVMQSLCTIALYRDMGPNVDHVGLSSGKLMRSVSCGTPVVVSRTGFGDDVTHAGLGCTINHPMEIPDALVEIDRRRGELSDNCQRFSIKHDYLSSWKDVRQFVLERVG
jgi:hypothetical protein